MDVIFDKPEWTAGETLKGRFVIPTGRRRQDLETPDYDVQIVVHGQEFAWVDLHTKHGSVAQDTHVFWRHVVKADPRPPNTNQEDDAFQVVYRFSIPLPTDLPASQTIAPNYNKQSRLRLDKYRINYILRVQLCENAQQQQRQQELPDFDWESAVEIAAGTLRESCVENPILASLGFMKGFNFNNEDTPDQEPDGKGPQMEKSPSDESTEGWRTLGRTWNVIVRAKCPWKKASAATCIELKVQERIETPGVVCCGLGNQVTFRLEANEPKGSFFRVSPGQSLDYTLVDPKGLLNVGGDETLSSLLTLLESPSYVIQPKISENVTWSAKEHFCQMDTKTWDLPPSNTFYLPKTNGNILTRGRLKIPNLVANTTHDEIRCWLLHVEVDLLFSLVQDGAVVGVTPRLPCHVRG